MNSLLLIINTLLIMTHTLPPLPYAMDALAPKMSKETLEYHYGKHLQTYIDNLNNLIKGTPYENMTLEEISVKADGPIYNNGAQAWNHAFFFNSFSPTPKSAPEGALAEAIKRDFGSFDGLKTRMAQAAAGLFGSGWVWLAENGAGELVVVGEQNAGNPMCRGMKPLLAIDVWEHAYYIDYRNRRADAVGALWNVIDWRVVEDRYAKE